MNPVDKAKVLREEHKRACLLCATSLIVLGALIGVAGFHGGGLVIEAVGLYLVAMV